MKFLVIVLCIVACTTATHILEKYETRIFDSDFTPLKIEDLLKLLARANLPSNGSEKIEVTSTKEIENEQ